MACCCFDTSPSTSFASDYSTNVTPFITPTKPSDYSTISAKMTTTIADAATIATEIASNTATDGTSAAQATSAADNTSSSDNTFASDNTSASDNTAAETTSAAATTESASSAPSSITSRFSTTTVSSKTTSTTASPTHTCSDTPTVTPCSHCYIWNSTTESSLIGAGVTVFFLAGILVNGVAFIIKSRHDTIKQRREMVGAKAAGIVV